MAHELCVSVFRVPIKMKRIMSKMPVSTEIGRTDNDWRTSNMDKTLSYFMREELKNEDIVEMAGPDSIKDENGKPVVFQIKRLRRDRVDQIYSHYRTLKPALDKNKRPYVVDGKMVMKEEKDYAKALRHVVAEALVYPNLRDEKLMKFYECIDVTEMPVKVFTQKEYSEVIKMLNHVLGIDDEDEEEQQDDLDSAKN